MIPGGSSAGRGERRVRTLIISDLHLGIPSGVDLLRDRQHRVFLLSALEHVDRVILLGDVIELWESRPLEAMEAARPFFEDLGAALDGREVIICPGNHDHALIATWLARLRRTQGRLGMEQRISPAGASPLLETLARWVAPSRLTAAYPGIWVRDDVYATHGHHLDVHRPPTTGERLLIHMVGRALGMRPDEPYEPELIEACVASTYRLLEWSGSLRRLICGRVGNRVAGALATARRGRHPASERDATRSFAARFGVGNAHLIMGHTHRAMSPPPESTLPGAGSAVFNCGCWLGRRLREGDQVQVADGHWVLIDDFGPPMLVAAGVSAGSRTGAGPSDDATVSACKREHKLDR